jgi:hypothetical protein
MAAGNTAADIRQLPKGIPSQDVKIRKIFLKRSSKITPKRSERSRHVIQFQETVDRVTQGLPAYFSACGKHATRGPEAIRRTIRPAISSVSSWTLSLAAAFAAVPTISRRAREGGHAEPVIGRAFARPVG